MRRAARNLPISSKKSLWALKKNDSRGAKVVHVEAGSDGSLHVGEAVGQREGQLLGGSGAGLADVVAGDGDGMPPGHRRSGEPDQIGDQAHRRPGREDVLLLGLVLLQDVVLNGAAESGPAHAVLLGHRDVHGHGNGGWTVDGHRGGDLVQFYAREQVLHVGQAVHRNSCSADFADRPLVVGVAAHEGGHVERSGQPGSPGSQQGVEPGIGVSRGAESREHPHGPQLAAVPGGIKPPGVGIVARLQTVSVGRVQRNTRHGVDHRWIVSRRSDSWKCN